MIINPSVPKGESSEGVQFMQYETFKGLLNTLIALMQLHHRKLMSKKTNSE
jgi:hypothetical protein